MKAFSKTFETADDRLTIHLEGYINESADLGMYNIRKLSKIYLDCKGIEVISSSGIIVWVNWFKSIVEQNPKIQFYFTDCPKVIFEQMVKVEGFIPVHSQIVTIQAPFFCPKCNSIKKAPIKAEDIVGKKIPEVICDECMSFMEPDFMVNKYADYLSRNNKVFAT
jgi:hypothetical protein